MLRLPASRHLRRLILGFALLLAGVASGHAAQFRYTDGLAPEAQVAAGLTRITPNQLTVLNAQIGRELALARAGDVRGFAGTFASRRTPAEQAESGLDTLAPVELARIDALVVALLASPASPSWPVWNPLNQGDDVQLVSDRPQIHGQVTAMYGWGSNGQTTYGGSLSSTYYDPARKFSATVEISNYRTEGGSLPRYLSRGRR